MDVVKKYKVFCVNENKYLEVWKMTTPDCCPNNSRHVIDHDQTEFLEQKFVENDHIIHVNINSKNVRTTNGNYCGEGRSFHIASNVSVQTEDIQIPVSMCIFGMRFCIREEHFGDRVSFIGQPETIAGVILQDVDANSGTTFMVNDTVWKNVVPGYHVLIGGEERQVVGVDSEASTITVETPFTSSHAAYSYVAVNVYVVKNFCLDTRGMAEVGYGAFGGKMLEKGNVLRMVYHKADPATSKIFSLNVEYMY